jgi:hypothetical protein
MRQPEYDPVPNASPRRSEISTTTQNEARKIRASLKHPVIDADGHWVEFPPLMRQEFKRIGGDRSLRRLGMTSF